MRLLLPAVVAALAFATSAEAINPQPDPPGRLSQLHTYKYKVARPQTRQCRSKTTGRLTKCAPRGIILQ